MSAKMRALMVPLKAWCAKRKPSWRRYERYGAGQFLAWKPSGKPSSLMAAAIFSVPAEVDREAASRAAP